MFRLGAMVNRGGALNEVASSDKWPAKCGLCCSNIFHVPYPCQTSSHAIKHNVWISTALKYPLTGIFLFLNCLMSIENSMFASCPTGPMALQTLSGIFQQHNWCLVPTVIIPQKNNPATKELKQKYLRLNLFWLLMHSAFPCAYVAGWWWRVLFNNLGSLIDFCVSV